MPDSPAVADPEFWPKMARVAALSILIGLALEVLLLRTSVATTHAPGWAVIAVQCVLVAAGSKAIEYAIFGFCAARLVARDAARLGRTLLVGAVLGAVLGGVLGGVTLLVREAVWPGAVTIFAGELVFSIRCVFALFVSTQALARVRPKP